jgi:CRP-like cAMP-binding protein
LKDEFDHSGPVMHLLLRYALALMAQISQTTVCTRHHSLDQQLCRWLLKSLDRLPGNKIVMTQELVANLLGVRREGVANAARNIQEAGLISYARGRIYVLDRLGLENRCCKCYTVVQGEYDRLLPMA